MRRSLAVAALLATTALVPGAAQAGAVVPFVQGIVAATGVSASAAAMGYAGLFGGAFGAGLTTGTFLFGTFAGRLVLSLGLSAIASALQERPTVTPSERMINYAQPTVYAEWVYGRTRKGGPLGFSKFSQGADVVTGEQAGRRHYSPVLAAHPCRQIVEHRLRDEVVEIDGDGVVTTAPFAGFYRIRPFLGHSGQVADPELVAQFPEVTTSHDFAGLSGAHIWAKRADGETFSTVYPDGREAAYAPVIDGNVEIYDPRDQQLKWTRNWALCMAHWVTVVHGRSVDWDEIAVQADVCDALVPVRGGGQVPRWRCDGTISDDETFDTQLAKFIGVADGFIYERGDGKVGIQAGRWVEPTVTLTETDFLSLEVEEGPSPSAPNEIAAQYVEPLNGWRETTTEPVVIDASQRQQRDEPRLHLCADHNQAWRALNRMAAVLSPKYRLQGTLTLAGYRMLGQRFARLRHPLVGEVYIQVGKLERSGGGLTFDLQAETTTPEDHPTDVSVTEPAKPINGTITTDTAVPDLSGLSGQALDGGRIRYDWTAPGDTSLKQQVRFRETGTTDWQIYDVTAGQQSFVLSGVGERTFEAQARNATVGNRPGAWQPSPFVLTNAVLNAQAPAALAVFSASFAGGRDVDVAFEGANDPNHAATRIYRSATGAGFGTAVLVHTAYAGPGVARTWTDTTPEAGAFDYFARPINGSGVSGPVAGPDTVTILM